MKKLFCFTLLASLLAASSLSAKTLDEVFNEAASFLQRGDYDQAISKYKEAIQMEPKSALAYNLLGMAYRFRYALTRDQKYRKEEIAAFEKALQLDSTYWVSLINLGATYYYMGEKKKAVPYFKKALELYPEHPERPQFEKMIREADQESKVPPAK